MSCKNTAKLVNYGTLSVSQGKEILHQPTHHTIALRRITMVNIQVTR